MAAMSDSILQSESSNTGNSSSSSSSSSMIGIMNLQRKCIEQQDQFSMEYNRLRAETILGQVWGNNMTNDKKDIRNCFAGSTNNSFRNRYTDVPAYEDTRVKIRFDVIKPAPEYDEPPGENNEKDKSSNISSKAQFMGISIPFKSKDKNSGGNKTTSKMYSEVNSEPPSDYINANYVSGYKPCGRSWDKQAYKRVQNEIRKKNQNLQKYFENFQNF